MDEREEIEQLRDMNAMLLKQLTGQINCAFFCALPECAKQLARNCNDDQNKTNPSND